MAAERDSRTSSIRNRAPLGRVALGEKQCDNQGDGCEGRREPYSESRLLDHCGRCGLRRSRHHRRNLASSKTLVHRLSQNGCQHRQFPTRNHELGSQENESFDCVCALAQRQRHHCQKWPLSTSKAVKPRLLLAKPPHPAICNLPYNASKAAVVSMTKSLALAHAADGIRVNCVCPGFGLP